eukprot:TRINITY_DN216_c0_g1_i2.p1 TRINITY_DN216_c0_g1~~TRINITY_DN216_c0_g1_i2.p1  ORF type:complete len:240 (+),score=58.10 TRINITY_DN216_c0_g1_i2:392-1111(+)
MYCKICRIFLNPNSQPNFKYTGEQLKFDRGVTLQEFAKKFKREDLLQLSASGSSASAPAAVVEVKAVDADPAPAEIPRRTPPSRAPVSAAPPTSRKPVGLKSPQVSGMRNMNSTGSMPRPRQAPLPPPPEPAVEFNNDNQTVTDIDDERAFLPVQMTGDGPNLDNFTVDQLKEMYLNVAAENRSLRELLAKEQKKNFDMDSEMELLKQNARDYSNSVMELYNRLQTDMSGAPKRRTKGQ